MRRIGGGLLRRVGRRIRDDLDADPYLPYILALALVLTGFWFWYLAPNFATRDEMSRLLDPMVALGVFLSDPGIESLRAGIGWGRLFGATFYLFGLALVPVVVVATLTGQLALFEAFRSPSYDFGHYTLWHATPEWVWTGALVFVRLFNVAFAVGCVYLTYRIATAIRDRATGRLAALLLTFTWGFLTIAHEGGEDMPALFFVLLTLYLLIGYVHTGADWRFYVASASGGAAIAFKLTAAPIVLAVGIAFLLRAREVDDWRAALFRPGTLVGGAVLGFVVITLGFPTILATASYDPLFARALGASADRAQRAFGPDAPIWWWFLRGYFSGLSLPLFAGSVVAVLAAGYQFWEAPDERSGILLVLFLIGTTVLLLSRWHDFRVHHLLPTFPLLMVLVALMLNRLLRETPRVGTAFTVFLLLTSGAYAVAGDVGYASMPRDEAVEWFDENAQPDDTVEVYRRHVQDTAVPHWMNVNHAFGPEAEGELVECPEYIELGYRDLLYLKDGTYYRNGEAQKQYVRGLLEGEYNYEIVAEFGPRPPNFVPERATPGSVTDLLRYGVVPHTDQYADEQELEPNQYTVVLERTGPCDGDRTIPF